MKYIFMSAQRAILSLFFVIIMIFSANSAEQTLSCSGVKEFPAIKNHVRQLYIDCEQTGLHYDVDIRVCTGTSDKRNCNNEGNKYFYVRNIVREKSEKARFKVTAQNAAEGQPSEDTYSLEYTILFRSDPCASQHRNQLLKCIAGKMAKVAEDVTQLSRELPAVVLPSLMPGYGCTDPLWCMAVLPNGDVFAGNPTVHGAPPMKPLGVNVLRNLEERRPRSFVVSCNHGIGKTCSGHDSFGNHYSGYIDFDHPLESRFDYKP